MPSLDPAAPIAELTRAIVDLPSESGHERELADAVEAALGAAGHLEVTRDGDAVVARTRLGRPRRVIIAGHLDTVPVNANLPAVDGSGPEGAELVGRGTVDMKGGVAILLKLAVELAEPSVDVSWVFYDHEEVEAELNGLGRLARTRPELLRGDFAVLAEPTGGEVEGGCNGTLRIDVTTRGRRAHTARAWKGENAIHAAAPVLARLAEHRPAEIEVDGLVYREGLQAVGITGGVAGNVVPDACTVSVNYRFAPSRDAAAAEAVVREIFDGFEVRVTDLAEGARPGLDAPLAQAFLGAVGGRPAPKYGWTDVARFSALGVPAVNYGPGDPSLAHADDERVPVAQLERCENGLRAWLTGPA
ncbi:MAG: succinyl-diaminopimelate desuccinylase [Actinomycetales bacterium]|nr:succinyl-diaminopimelate desuccinylase [Actinomycetales bacterium]